MWWKRKRWLRDSGESSWCKDTAYDDTDTTSFLDITQHRCTSIASLLSIEQSLVMHDDKNNMMLVPKICLEGTIPTQVDFIHTVPVDAENTIDNEDNSNGSVEVTSITDESDDASLHSDILLEPPKRSAFAGTSCTNRNSVRFGTVEVYEHELIMAESSVPVRGAPLGVGWNKVAHHQYESVDEYLFERYQGGGPRPLAQLLLPSQQRVDILLNLGYSMREIRCSAREAGVVRTKRLQSARFSSRTKCFRTVRKTLKDLSRRSVGLSTPKAAATKNCILDPCHTEFLKAASTFPYRG